LIKTAVYMFMKLYFYFNLTASFHTTACRT